MNRSPAIRTTLLLLLLAFCQGTLVVHDGQHVLPDISHCAVCGGHSAQIAGAPSTDLQTPAQLVATQRLTIPAPFPATARPLQAFRSRGPPPTLS